MTDNPSELILGHPHTQKNRTQAGEVWRALHDGKQAVVDGPKGGRDGAEHDRGEKTHRRLVVVDEAWHILPKPDHPARLLSRYRRYPESLLQTLAGFGEEVRGASFLRSPPTPTSPHRPPAAESDAAPHDQKEPA